MKAAIREKFLINVSLGQCKRAKQRALYDFEGGLIEHYARLWEYRQAILDTNPGSTCILDDEETEYGNSYFRRFYICFKGVKDGWKAGCRRVIGLDGCFLKHTCRGELLTAIGRDANNQMYPIAWAVVKVENAENWCWFISLLAEDLELGHGTGITVISDSHKGLLDVWGAVTEIVLASSWYNSGIHLLAQPSVAATETTPRGKTIEVDAVEPSKLKKQGRKRKVAEPSAAELPFRIYHKNIGRSERIFNQKVKKTGFGPNGEGSTADKAFSL
ncbi:calcium/proton exchanger [Tanacetum coccineum]